MPGPSNDAPARKIALVAIGSAGDVYPMMALASALATRGHSVTVTGFPKFGILGKKLGLQYHPVCAEEEFEKVVSDPRYRGRAWRAMAGLIRPVYRFIEREHVPGSTILVALPSALGAEVAHEKLGIPLVSVHLMPASLRSRYEAPGLPFPDLPAALGPLPRLWRSLQFTASDLLLAGPIVKPVLKEFRAEMGLPPPRRSAIAWGQAPDLVIGLFPEWFGQPQPDWPPNTVLAGFPLFDGSTDEPIPQEVDSFLSAGAPPVVFATASEDRFARDYFRESVEACVLGGYRGLLLTQYRHQVSADLPPQVLHCDYVPLHLLLPRSLALVHHAGVGTGALALAAGIPQICVPFAHDQSDNAARFQRLGVGLVMHRSSYRASSALNLLHRVLGSSDVRHACNQYADKLANESPLQAACRLIESCLEA